MNHLTKEDPSNAAREYKAEQENEFYCRQCHARITKNGIEEYGHLTGCVHSIMQNRQRC